MDETHFSDNTDNIKNLTVRGNLKVKHGEVSFDGVGMKIMVLIASDTDYQRQNGFSTPSVCP